MSATAEPARLPVEEKFDGLIQEVEAELNEIEPRYRRLVEIHQRLTGNNTAPAMPVSRGRGRTRTTASASSTATHSGSAAPGGDRSKEALGLIQDNPGIKIPELAAKMGLNSSNYLYRIRPKLEGAGLIRRDADGGLFPVQTGDLTPSPERIRELEAAAK